MARETASIKQQRLEAARHIIRETITYEDFSVTKKIKFGPRYYVAEGKKNNRRSVFKICLFPDSVDHLTNEKFSREIIFLNFVQHSRFRQLRAAAPRVVSSALKPRAWYIREYLFGQTQNISGGNIRFKASFFTTPNLRWLLALFSDIQKIKKSDLSPFFKTFLYPPDFTKHLWYFIKPHWQRIESYMRWPGLARLIKREFKERAMTYNHAPNVLAHQEPYAPHFLKQPNGTFRMIDWENIGWSTPTHDTVTVWMRAHEHPAWQEQLYRRTKRRWHHYKKFDELWTTEVLIQSVFNIISYHFYDDKHDLESLVQFSDKKIKEILTGTFRHIH